LSPLSASRKRRYRQRKALAVELRISDKFSELPAGVQAAMDALLEARDAAKHASRHSDPEVRSRTSNTVARRARELETLLQRGHPASGSLLDQLTDAQFNDLQRRELLGDRDAIEEMDRLAATPDDAQALLRRVLAGPGWWELAPELADKPRAHAEEAEQEAPLSESVDDGEPFEGEEEAEPFELEGLALPDVPEPVNEPLRLQRFAEPVNPLAWRSKASRSSFVDTDIF
jgi:hypothetical protein